MREQEAIIASAFDIAGVVCAPEDIGAGAAKPAVLLLGGSGANTRDGDLDLPGSGVPGKRPGTLRRIAHHLAYHGIASLRWDRRGFGSSGGQAENGDYSSDLADAKACLEWLRSQPGIDGARVAVAGHSAGALTACHVCRDVPDIAACALLGALASPIEEMLAWNLGRVTRHWGELTADQQAAIERDRPAELVRSEGLEQLIAGARHGDEVVHLERKGICLEFRTARLRQDLATSYADEMRHVHCPALILHGGADLNVPVADALVAYAALTKAGNTDVELVVLPGLDHYFNPVAPDPALRVVERLTLAAMGRPMSRPALDAIARWAVRTLAR